jgi:hypothetical protein
MRWLEGRLRRYGLERSKLEFSPKRGCSSRREGSRGGVAGAMGRGFVRGARKCDHLSPPPPHLLPENVRCFRFSFPVCKDFCVAVNSGCVRSPFLCESTSKNPPPPNLPPSLGYSRAQHRLPFTFSFDRCFLIFPLPCEEVAMTSINAAHGVFFVCGSGTRGRIFGTQALCWCECLDLSLCA